MPREYTKEQREAQRARVRAHYIANKQYYKDKAKKSNEAHRAELREWLTAYLIEHPCVDCGNTDVRVLEFDHVIGEKSFNISDAARKNVWTNLKTLQEEVEKCEVRCANCHRIVTSERLGWHNAIGDIRL